MGHRLEGKPDVINVAETAYVTYVVSFIPWRTFPCSSIHASVAVIR